MTTVSDTARERQITPSGDRAVAVGVMLLGVLLAVNSLLGPLAFEIIEYRYATR